MDLTPKVVKSVSRHMLVTARDAIIQSKGIFQKAIEIFGNSLPNPNKDNTLEPNSHILLEIRDKFFSYYDLPDRQAIFEVAWKVLIDEYEHDPHYRHIFDWFVEELVEAVILGRWKPRPIGHPSGFWKEPRVASEGNYGKYKGRAFKKYVDSIPDFRNIYETLKDIFESKLTNY